MDLCWALDTCLFMVSTIHRSVLGSGYLSVYGEYIHGSVLSSGYLSVYGEYHPWICTGFWVPVCLW